MTDMRNTVIRSMHDLGLAVWCGGSLMGAVGLNGATNDIRDPTERVQVASAGWARWSPVAAVAIGTHLVGGAGLVLEHRDRVRGQAGVTANTVVKTLVTAAAMATTAYSGIVGAKLAETSSPAQGAVKPDSDTDPKVATLQQQQRLLQWATPLLTGVLVVLGAQQGEQQRPTERLVGVVKKIAQ